MDAGSVQVWRQEVFISATCCLTLLSVENTHRYIHIKIQQDATLVTLFYCKTTLHVSGTFRTHHQEYNKL
jgi:hypothetical protein